MLEYILLSLLLCALVYWWSNQRNVPGPRRVPLVGSLPFLTTKKGILDFVLDNTVTKHRIARVDLGIKTFYVINDFSLAKSLFDKPEFCGRVPSRIQLMHRYINNTPQGIIFTQDNQWITHRRFSLKTLKDFGFGKKSIEDSIHFEVEELIEKFLSCPGETLVGTDFNAPIINILWYMVAGTRFTPEDKAGMKMVENVTKIFTTGTKLENMPIVICKIFPKLTGYSERVEVLEYILTSLMDTIEKHKDERDITNPKDFIDVYLNEMENQGEGNEYSKEDLVGCIFDFFVAGTETSSTTLKWAVLFLTLHQDVQERLFVIRNIKSIIMYIISGVAKRFCPSLVAAKPVCQTCLCYLTPLPPLQRFRD